MSAPVFGTQEEIIAAPLTLYNAPYGTAFPPIDANQAAIIAGGWDLIGALGPLDYDSTGLTVTHNETMTTWTSVGATGIQKVWRTNEQLEIAVSLADISADMYGLALNDVEPTIINATTGVAGEEDVPLYQGIDVAVYALTAVCQNSPLDNSLQMMYCVPAVYQAANPAPVFKLGAPAMLALTFATVLDKNGGGFGTLRQQSAAKV